MSKSGPVHLVPAQKRYDTWETKQCLGDIDEARAEIKERGAHTILVTVVFTDGGSQGWSTYGAARSDEYRAAGMLFEQANALAGRG